MSESTFSPEDDIPHADVARGMIFATCNRKIREDAPTKCFTTLPIGDYSKDQVKMLEKFLKDKKKYSISYIESDSVLQISWGKPRLVKK